MDQSLLGLPPLDALRGFVAVERRMSITLAAQDLCLTQSAVSRQIQSLEEHFGTPLFIRKNRTLVLTDAGRKLAALVSPWMAQLAAFNRSLRTDARPQPVTIATSVGVSSLWLLPRLAAFSRAHPGIDVRVTAGTRVLDMRQEGIDLALRYAPHTQVPVGSAKLFDEMIVPVASPELADRAARNPRALLDEVLLEYDERTVPWLRWSDWLGAAQLHGAAPRAYLQCNHYDQVIRSAVDGLGIALGRIPLIQSWLTDGRLAAWPAHAPRATTWAYWLIDGPAPIRPEVAAFRDWIMAEGNATACGLPAASTAAIV